MKYAGTTAQDTNGYDIYKIFKDLFLSTGVREEMLLEGIQSTNLNKIRSNSGDKKTSAVDAENKLETIYKNKYKINLDHQILTDHGAFYPQALYNDLTFELTLASAAQVVRGSDTSKLVYKLKNIQLEYEVIPYTAGTRDSEHYINPDITKVSVTVNGSPNRVYNEGITGIDMWREASRFFEPKRGGSPKMNLTKYLTSNKFGLFY